MRNRLLALAAVFCGCGPPGFPIGMPPADVGGSSGHYLTEEEIDEIPNAFPTTWDEPRRPELMPMYRRAVELNNPAGSGKLVSIFLRLGDVRVPMRVRECGDSRAYYDPNNRSITICYEFLVENNRLLGKTGDALYQLDAQAAAMLTFTSLHEIGHAVIDVLGLWTDDIEEDVVDRFAILLITGVDDRDLVDRIVRAPVAFFQHHGEAVNATGGQRAGDVHSPSGERAFDTLCLLYGRHQDPELGQRLGGYAQDCIRFARDAARQWNEVLEPYSRIDTGKTF